MLISQTEHSINFTENSFEVLLYGHFDITPKYINAKKTTMSGCPAPETVKKITTFQVFFSNNKLQGTSNEAGIKRIRAFCKWMEKNNIHPVERCYLNSISKEEFFRLHNI